MCSENNLQKSILPLYHVDLIDLTQVSDLVTYFIFQYMNNISILILVQSDE